MKISIDIEQIIKKFVWKHKRIWIAKSCLEKEGQSRKYHTPWIQTILQSCNNQNRMVLAQKKAHGSMEQNRVPKNKPTHLWSINLRWKKILKYIKDSFLNKWCWKILQLHVKEWKNVYHTTIYKNKLKIC